MSRIVVCDCCTETAPLSGGFVSALQIPDDWHEIDWGTGIASDLCPNCYMNFQRVFLGAVTQLDAGVAYREGENSE